MQSKSLSTVLVAFAVVFGMSSAIASRQGAVSRPDGGDWLYADHDLAGTRYSHLKQISAHIPPGRDDGENSVQKARR